ncbi:hypothetical protein Tcan_00974, partial [Toxocara canis]
FAYSLAHPMAIRLPLRTSSMQRPVQKPYRFNLFASTIINLCTPKVVNCIKFPTQKAFCLVSSLCTERFKVFKDGGSATWKISWTHCAFLGCCSNVEDGVVATSTDRRCDNNAVQAERGGRP